MSKKKITLLCSGGIDSTAMIHFYKQLEYEVVLLFINYGQMSSRRELAAVKRISQYYRVPFEVCRLQSTVSFSEGVIIGRNIFFLVTALMISSLNAGQIALGIHKGTDYPDCSEQFIAYCNSIFDLYTNGAFVATAPFVNWTKAEIFNYCSKNSVPIKLTYSCELGLKQPCNKCPSCKEISHLNETYRK